MKKSLRWFGYLAAALLLLILLAASWAWISSSRILGQRLEGQPERLAPPSPKLIADGTRQLHVLGCLSCHGEGLRGNLMFEAPNVATVYAPNLTLLAAKASDQQLARAIRQGIGADGRPLFVMPSAQYSQLGDDEVAALIHTIRALPKGGRPTPEIKVGPLGRIGLLNGKFTSQPELVKEFAAKRPPELGAPFALGRKITLTNCTECHGAALTGGEPKPGSPAPDLIIAGAYDLPAFRTLLREGIGAGGKKLGLMGNVARNDFRYLTDAEIAAIHAYLVERANRAP